MFISEDISAPKNSPKIALIQLSSIVFFLFFFTVPIPYLNIVNYTVNDVTIYVNHTGPYTRDVIGYRIQVTSVDGIVNYDVSYFIHDNLVI